MSDWLQRIRELETKVDKQSEDLRQLQTNLPMAILETAVQFKEQLEHMHAGYTEATKGLVESMKDLNERTGVLERRLNERIEALERRLDIVIDGLTLIPTATLAPDSEMVASTGVNSLRY